MKKPVQLNGIVLTDELIGEIKTLQADNGDMAKYRMIQVIDVIDIVANLNAGSKAKPLTAEKQLEYVSLLTDVSKLLGAIAQSE